MKSSRFLSLFIIAGLMIAPAMAGEKYLAGSPELDAALSGTNEFSPGDEVSLTIIIENSGLNIAKIIRSDIITREDNPNTAKLVSVGLGEGDAPLTVKSDPQMIGDITGGRSSSATFLVEFDADALPGTYTLPIFLEYTYLAYSEEIGTQLITYDYDTKEEILSVDVKVVSEVRLEVEDIGTESINVGTEGFVTLTVRNTGQTEAQKAILRLARNDNSPLIPTDGNVYVGDLAPGEAIEARFKVSVSEDAEIQTYPMDVYLEYEDEDGDSVLSDIETFGVPVGGKIDFAVISAVPVIKPGDTDVLEIVYKNVGDATVYDAQARISAVDPFTSNDDTAYLGDLAPGEESVARFEVSVDSTGTVKMYGLDSEIRYKDILGNSQISDTIKIKVEVVPLSEMATLLTNPLVLVLAAFIVIGAGYFVWKRRTSSE